MRPYFPQRLAAPLFSPLGKPTPQPPTAHANHQRPHAADSAQHQRAFIVLHQRSPTSIVTTTHMVANPLDKMYSQENQADSDQGSGNKLMWLAPRQLLGLASLSRCRANPRSKPSQRESQPAHCCPLPAMNTIDSQGPCVQNERCRMGSTGARSMSGNSEPTIRPEPSSTTEISVSNITPAFPPLTQIGEWHHNETHWQRADEDSQPTGQFVHNPFPRRSLCAA